MREKSNTKCKKEVTAKFILPCFISLVCIMSTCFHLVKKSFALFIALSFVLNQMRLRPTVNIITYYFYKKRAMVFKCLPLHMVVNYCAFSKKRDLMRNNLLQLFLLKNDTVILLPSTVEKGKRLNRVTLLFAYITKL